MMQLLGTHFGTYEIVRDSAGAVALRGLPGDPSPSPLGPGFLELQDHSTRVRAPAVRAGWLKAPGQSNREGRGAEPFVEVSWDRALDLVAGEIGRVRSTYGNASIFGGSYGWASAGRFHHAQSQLKRFLNLVGGHVSAVNTYSFGAAAVLLPHVLGPAHEGACETAPLWSDIARGTELMLAYGGVRPSNAQVEAGGCGRHTSLQWLTRACGRGMRLVVFSPSRRDVPPGLDALHVFVRPNTDSAVMLGMAHAILAARLADQTFLARCTTGHDQFSRYVNGEIDGVAKTPEWAAAISGVPGETIRELAGEVVRRRSLINVAWSLQRARHGEQPYWTAIALAALAGHIGKPGGGFAFGLGSVNSVGQPTRRLVGPAVAQRHNAVDAFIPVARIADMLLDPGATIDYDGRRLTLPHIRFVYWAGGNPFHHHQDINRLRRAFARPQTIIVNEPFWTATARHADIVLPAALPTERDDIAVSSRDNWIVASRRVVAPFGDARTDYDIFSALAERAGVGAAFTEGRSEREWLVHLYEGYRARVPELPPFEAFWEAGSFELAGDPDPTIPQRRLECFVADPVGCPLATPSGRIEIVSETIASFGYGDCPGHPTWLPPEEYLGAAIAAKWPIHLISPQPEGRLHSQLDAAHASRCGKRDGREQIQMNAGDAKSRGIADGDVVRVFNARGACLAVAAPSMDIMPGVAILPTGAWYDPSNPDVPDSLDKHGNPNVLTADVGTSRLAQGPSPNSCLVDIARVPTSAPPVTAFLPPPFAQEKPC